MGSTSTEFESDHFDRLPDSLIIAIFNRIGDVKTLGFCCAVNRRFSSLVSQVDQIIVRVDCVISDDDEASTPPSSLSSATVVKSLHPISSFSLIFFNSLLRRVQSITQFVVPSQNGQSSIGKSFDPNDVVEHYSPSQALKNFKEIKDLRIELPTGELSTDEGVLLKWKASFGSTLDNCVILWASSVVTTSDDGLSISNEVENDDDGIVLESLYSNGVLKLRVVWTIRSLIAASARHFLLQPVIAEHETLEKLILTDANGQGMLCMNKEQLCELRAKPLVASSSSSSKRTLVPALNMRLWYAPKLELPNGIVLKGATLVAARLSEKKEMVVNDDESWVAEAWEEPFSTAAKMLLKRRIYCLEISSF